MRRTSVICIDHHAPPERELHKAEFWKTCLDEGINIQYLESAAVPTTISGGGHEISQVEWSFCFQGPKKNIIMKDTIGQAIVVSYMRAIHQAFGPAELDLI